MNPAPLHSLPGPRTLPVLWRDHSWALAPIRSSSSPPPASSGWKLTRRHAGGAQSIAANSPSGLGLKRGKRPPGLTFHYSKSTLHNFHRAFTVLEMLVVITIIGFLAALALPHLPGMTRANSMTTAVQQLLGDCALARQLAMSHRSTVYMVFVPPYVVGAAAPVNEQSSFNNLLAHQYGAYALVSLRTVGDQPGQAHPQYLTEWKPLPDGVFVAPWKFASQKPVMVTSTNTLSGTVNVFQIFPFAQVQIPFPATDAVSTSGTAFAPFLPCIGFSPLGQLATNGDEYIPLDRGRVLYPVGAGVPAAPVAATPMEAPAGNATNNCNLIHIDWLTGRAKIERNQQR